MARARKGMRAPVKKAKRKKTNPRKRIAHNVCGDFSYMPSEDEAEETKETAPAPMTGPVDADAKTNDKTEDKTNNQTQHDNYS